LSIKYTICNETYIDDNLHRLLAYHMENLNVPQQSNKYNVVRRKKRFLPAVALAVSAAAAIWEGVSYFTTKSAIEDARLQIDRHSSLITRLAVDLKINHNFLYVSQEIKTLGSDISREMCASQQEIMSIISKMQLNVEFNDLIESFKNEKLTSNMIPYTEIKRLVEVTPQLANTKYTSYPFYCTNTGTFK
jgi:hypothetical protein